MRQSCVVWRGEGRGAGRRGRAANTEHAAPRPPPPPSSYMGRPDYGPRPVRHEQVAPVAEAVGDGAVPDALFPLVQLLQQPKIARDCGEGWEGWMVGWARPRRGVRAMRRAPRPRAARGTARAGGGAPTTSAPAFMAAAGGAGPGRRSERERESAESAERRALEAAAAFAASTTPRGARGGEDALFHTHRTGAGGRHPPRARPPCPFFSLRVGPLLLAKADGHVDEAAVELDALHGAALQGRGEEGRRGEGRGESAACLPARPRPPPPLYRPWGFSSCPAWPPWASGRAPCPRARGSRGPCLER